MKTRRFLIALYAVLLLLAIFPAEAFAYGASTYHPPAITVVTYNAPSDLEIQIEVQKNGERFPVQTECTRRAWELSFQLSGCIGRGSSAPTPSGAMRRTLPGRC